MAPGLQLTPSNAVAVVTLGMLPALSNADLLDVIAGALNELDRRGDDIELRERSISSKWADVSLGDRGYRAVFHDVSIAAQASEPVNAEPVDAA
ncbi:hypothetical protein [Paractinoplanes toevensis]|uniref:Uncharacterized protein n=1 Tax=Paractinoplanes toevensis TaxID=571911 RepID=A0A919T9V6_9ACTN|nr:hypothetical protein [Actinoplanes toevensis]GIM90344.1 hypothetical protein Ato02nite_021370 [Actinoplanes toevensis]